MKRLFLTALVLFALISCTTSCESALDQTPAPAPTYTQFPSPTQKPAPTPDGKSVLCRAQYSASIGGRNQPISGISISVEEVGSDLQAPTVYETDSSGQVQIPMKVESTYDISVSYEKANKTTRLKYNGEATLFIRINPDQPRIVSIEFVGVYPSGPKQS